MATPDSSTPEELRSACAALDATDRKIVAAMVTTMIDRSDRVRDREWISEQFARIVAIGLDVGDDDTLDSAAEGVERVRGAATARAPTLLPIAFGIFGQIALTLQQRGGPVTMEAAVAELVTYVGE